MASAPARIERPGADLYRDLVVTRARHACIAARPDLTAAEDDQRAALENRIEAIWADIERRVQAEFGPGVGVEMLTRAQPEWIA